MPLLLALLLTSFVFCFASSSGKSNAPNLVYILTDDTDVLLGSERALPKTQALLASQGARFTHFRTHSPKCTPSRTGQLVGRYYHNVRPSDSGPGLNQSTMFEPTALFPALHAAGYLTSIVGKVHNSQASWLCSDHNTTFPFAHVSTQCSPCGGYFNPNYVVKGLHDATTRREHVDTTAWNGYSHAQYGNRSVAFIREAVSARRPFFAYIGTTGPHLPSSPAPWHLTKSEQMPNASAPRTASFNLHTLHQHPSIVALPRIAAGDLATVDLNMRDRLATLWSVDDLVAEVVTALDELGVLNETFVMFSSDHGYHLGQHKLPMEKMWPYETDIRIPFYVRGPGIAAGQELSVMGMNIDIAPTLLDLAGVAVPSSYDGESLVPLLIGDGHSKAKAAAEWRTRTVIAFAEGAEQTWGGVTLANATVETWSRVIHPPAKAPNGELYSFDNPENQWRMLRTRNKSHDFAFVEWDPRFVFENVSFRALFDIASDPWETTNLWETTDVRVQEAWIAELATLFTCSGHFGKKTDCP